MSKARTLGRRQVDRLYPALPRGAHHLTREKERRAYLLGFEAGYREAKVRPDPTP